VRGPEFSVLKSYAISESFSKTGTLAPAAVAAAPVASAVTPGTVEDTKPAAPIRKGTAADKTVLPIFSEAQTIANLPDTSLITDFIKHDDQLLMASTDGTRIQIFDVTTELKVMAHGAPPHPVRILSLKWWSPDDGTRLYLAANVWSDRDKNVRGELFLLEGDALRPKIQKIPRILGTFDLNGDGRPETLMGQEFVGETFFGRRLNELKLTDNKIEYFKPRIELPRHFTVLGSIFCDLTGDGQLETAYVRDRILYIYSGKKRLYKSPKQMGGSLSFLTYDIDPNFKDGPNTTVEFEISPVATDLDGDGHTELLAVASERSIFGSLAVSPGVKKSWLAIFKYKNGRFESGSLGNEIDIPLQGLAVTPKQILMVATAPGNLMSEGAQSHLLSYSLAQ
jgi:WD40 repeat protein